MKIAARQTLHKIYSIASVTSLVLGLLAPFTSPQAVSAGTLDGANTDLFTGQFIPAYLGSAYDPSEAFKQMAGMTVYVFSYDTYGKVVNNFAYKTQIKADGSFQAAGLPNASHYGICVSDQIYKNNGNNPANFANYYDSSLSYFRTPLPQDNLTVNFAYNQQVYPTDDTVDTQATPPPPQPGQTASSAKDEQISLKGCRTFLTSSRTVDISNHVNIFPLVPNSVLSVIINDSKIGYDAYSSNRPYEIYAQRVVLNNSSDQTSQQAYDNCMTNAQKNYDAATQSGNLITDITAFTALVAARINCQQAQNAADSANNYETNGPVIRGRTITYQGPKGGAATIFQAFAPRGEYAITYWRPNDRDPQTTTTYLNFDGTSPLNTYYNGLAFEQVGYPDKTSWQTLSSRDPSTSAGNAWIAQPGSINIWGIIGIGKNGSTQPQAGAQVYTADPSLSMVDLKTRTCSHTADGRYTVGVFGIFFFSSANSWCNTPSTTNSQSPSAITNNTTSSEISLPDQGKYIGTPSTTVTVTGNEGPARNDLNFIGLPSKVASGILKLKGKPLANASIDLLSSQRVMRGIATSNSSGYFEISSSYFTDSNSTYKIRISSNRLPQRQATYTIDRYSLANLFNQPVSFGTIALDSHQSMLSSFLATLNFENALSLFRVPESFASSPSGSLSSGTYKYNSSGPFAFMFNTDASMSANEAQSFTMANYNIENAHVLDPNDDSCFVGCHNVARWSPANTKLLTKHHDSSGNDDAYFVEGDKWDSASNTLTNDPNQAERENKPILGVVLDENKLDGWMQTIQQDTDWQHTISDNMDPGTSKKFNLVLDFTKKCDKKTVKDSNGNTSEVNNCSAQQNQDDLTPPAYSASVPIMVTKNADGSYKITYDAIVLESRSYNCSEDSNGGISGWFTTTTCNAAYGLVRFLSNTVDMVANTFLYVDPFKQDIVLMYWNIIRNIVNGLFVFILILAGVAIMFKYEPKTFSIQSVLTKLLITIVLVNFSVLIIQAAIDVTNVLSFGGFSLIKNVIAAAESAAGVQTSGGLALGAGLGGIAVAILAGAALTGGIGFIGILLAVFAIFVGLAYVIFRIIFDYFIRLAILWICIISAPAAMASRITPGADKYFKKWSSLLVGTLLAQVTLGIVLAVAVGVLRTSIDQKDFLNALVELMLAIALFYMAVKAPNKVAAAFGAGMTANLEGNIKKAAKASKGQLDKLGKSRAENKARKQVDEADRKIDEESQQKALNQHRNWAARNFIYRPALNIGYGARRQWAAAGRGLEGKIAPSQDDLNKAFDSGLSRAQSEARSRQQHEKPALVQQRIEEAQFNNETDTDKRMADYLTKISESNRQASLEMLNVGSSGLPADTIRFERVRGGARTAAGGFNANHADFLKAWNDTPLAQRAPELANAYLSALQSTNGGAIDNAAQLKQAIQRTSYGGLTGSAAFKKGLQDKGMDFVYFGESDAYGLAGAQVVNKVGGKLSPTGEIMESIKTQTAQIKGNRPLTP